MHTNSTAHFARPHEGRLPNVEGGVHTDRLTVITLAPGVVKRCHEGQYDMAFTDRLEEARQLRTTDPKVYTRELQYRRARDQRKPRF